MAGGMQPLHIATHYRTPSMRRGVRLPLKPEQRHANEEHLQGLTIGPILRAGIVQTLCEGIAKYCPRAWVAIISNPVNSTVPIAAEVFKRAGGHA